MRIERRQIHPSVELVTSDLNFPPISRNKSFVRDYYLLYPTVPQSMETTKETTMSMRLSKTCLNQNVNALTVRTVNRREEMTKSVKGFGKLEDITITARKAQRTITKMKAKKKSEETKRK